VFIQCLCDASDRSDWKNMYSGLPQWICYIDMSIFRVHLIRVIVLIKFLQVWRNFFYYLVNYFHLLLIIYTGIKYVHIFWYRSLGWKDTSARKWKRQRNSRLCPIQTTVHTFTCWKQQGTYQDTPHRGENLLILHWQFQVFRFN